MNGVKLMKFQSLKVIMRKIFSKNPPKVLIGIFILNFKVHAHGTCNF